MYNNFLRADVAQLVEHNLAKVGVAGSNPVVRSICFRKAVAFDATAFFVSLMPLKRLGFLRVQFALQQFWWDYGEFGKGDGNEGDRSTD